MYYLQSAFEKPLVEQFTENHIWKNKLMNVPKFTPHLEYCHQFEKNLQGRFVYIKTLRNN